MCKQLDVTNTRRTVSSCVFRLGPTPTPRTVIKIPQGREWILGVSDQMSNTFVRPISLAHLPPPAYYRLGRGARALVSIGSMTNSVAPVVLTFERMPVPVRVVVAHREQGCAFKSVGNNEFDGLLQRIFRSIVLLIATATISMQVLCGRRIKAALTLCTFDYSPCSIRLLCFLLRSKRGVTLLLLLGLLVSHKVNINRFKY